MLSDISDAARSSDPIQHTDKIEWMLRGAAAGVLAGVALVILWPAATATAGAGVVVAGEGAAATAATTGAVAGAAEAAGGTSLLVRALWGGVSGKWGTLVKIVSAGFTGIGAVEWTAARDFAKSLINGVDTGVISGGSNNVQIDHRAAARAGVDVVACKGTPPIYIPDHYEKKIAQGAMTVQVNHAFLARVGCATECGAVISWGAQRVHIGGPTITVMEIDDEMPRWLALTIEYGGLITGLLGSGFVGYAAGALGQKVFGSMGEAVGKWMFPDSPDLQATVQLLFEKAGSAVVSRGASSLFEYASANPCANSFWRSDPVDLGSGAVVDRQTDLTLPGVVSLKLGRNYNSIRSADHNCLGLGGWTLSIEQWIYALPGRIELRDEEGRDVYFPKIAPGESAFHRPDRITLRALPSGGFEAYSHKTRLTRAYLPAGRSGLARLSEIRDAHGNRIRVEYRNETIARIIDTAGREVRATALPDGRILRLEVWSRGEPVESVTYGYSERGELASARDALGNAETYEYDDSHRLTKKTRRDGVSFHYSYDDDTGYCKRAWGDGDIHAGEISVDFKTRTVRWTSAGEPRVLHINKHGLVVREETPDGRLLEATEYDESLFVVARSNGNGETTRYDYDAMGNQIREVDPAGNVTTWEIQDDLPVRRTDPGGIETRYAHDARGSLTHLRDPRGVEHRFSYDELGRLTGAQSGDVNLVTLEYDAEHNAVLERDGRGAETRYRYDEMGRAVARIDALGRETSVVYDPLGRVIEAHYPDGTRTHCERDAQGRLVAFTDSLGQVTTQRYAGTGVLRAITRPDGTTFELDYDAEERLREVKNPNGELYNFEHDVAGHVIVERTFDGRTLRYDYDAAGRLLCMDPGDGAIRRFTRDLLGHLLSDSSPSDEIRFERDPLGRLLKATLIESAGKAVTAITRDRYGRVVSEAQNGAAVEYEYDAHDRRRARRLPGGRTTRYGYDSLGALAWVEHDGERITIERDVLGREARFIGPRGRFEVRSDYDAMDRLIARDAVAVSPAGELLRAIARHSWGYDELGRCIEAADSRWGAASFAYNEVDRLLRRARGRAGEIFDYDPAGGLRGIVSSLEALAETPPWTTAAGGLLGAGGGFVFESDSRRRRTRRVRTTPDDGGDPRKAAVEYRWDDRDRLREVRLAGGRRVHFAYDAFGRRIRKEILDDSGASAIEFLWDGDVLCADMGTPSGLRTFVHEPGTFRVMLQGERGHVLSCVHDQVGATSELLDESGAVVWSADASPWGRLGRVYRSEQWAAKGPPVQCPFRLLGHYEDEETGLSCTRFRYFDSDFGKWLSPDPLGIAGGSNLFDFDGSPTLVVDPLGLAPRLNLGGGANPMPGAVNVDIRIVPGTTVVADANALPFATGSFGEVHSINPYGFNPVSSEVARVLEPGGTIHVTADQQKNPFVPGKNKAPIAPELARVSGPSPLAAEHAFGTMARSDGSPIKTENLRTSVFKKSGCS